MTLDSSVPNLSIILMWNPSFSTVRTRSRPSSFTSAARSPRSRKLPSYPRPICKHYKSEISSKYDRRSLNCSKNVKALFYFSRYATRTKRLMGILKKICGLSSAVLNNLGYPTLNFMYASAVSSLSRTCSADKRFSGFTEVI